MKKVFYSKDFKDILKIKSNFFLDNDPLLKQAHKWNKLYSNQPKRTNCKNCGVKLGKSMIYSHFAKYTVCKSCGHFNGINQDTEKYNKEIYSNKSSSNLYLFYKKDYSQRCKNIYLPKLKFLKKILKKKFDIIDFGCGAGHFLKVCENMNIVSSGYEFNKDSVRLGNKFLKISKIKHIQIDEIYSKILNANSKVISLLGVIEHLRFPNKVFEAFKQSKSQYLFISVPLSSFTVLIEHVFPNVFPRLLGGVHNNLYSPESINYTIKKHKFKIIGEWWFGSDAMGLMRSMLYNSKSKNKDYIKFFDKYCLSLVNEFQSIIDKKKLCDEVHLVIKK
tara:strand:- start:346 stop:1344 length:999 start_codon:yes stop_codon:yes gene_type:complete